MATKTKKIDPADDLDAVESSGNVFADLGLPDADELMLKAKLATAVADLVREKGWSQRKAAGLLGLTQPEVCAILNGKLRGFSLARLIRSLKALGAGKVTVHIELEGNRELVVAV
ncbi:MAG: family transcriptional regulator [Cyanobacteria bacterium RYN_339]|nr:family transcriptional regulator [Cyanobacteria bacterium RYN_339]